MSALMVVAIGLVGGVGAVARFVLDGAVARRAGRDFPYGTLAVNVLGSLVLGVVVGAAVRGDAYDVVATGLLGSFTTFSTWALETHRLGEDGQLRLGALNVIVSLVLGIGAAWGGRHLGGVL
jgi:fluoride exporter